MKYSISLIIVLIYSIAIFTKQIESGKSDKKLGRLSVTNSLPIERVSNKQILVEEIVETVEVPLIPSSTTTEYEVNTLVELPVTSSTSIAYYFPYFYKTHLITFADEVDTTILISNCPDSGCDFCDPIIPLKCLKCGTGFFLADNSCVSYCPEGFVSDTLRFKCIETNLITANIVYTKAYSFGSCENMCEKISLDCSCSPSCKFRGNCCTDYNTVNCERIVQNSKNEKECDSNSNCLYCDNKIKLTDSIFKCNQCEENFYLFEGKCYETCPDTTIENKINFICKKKPACNINNCDSCSSNDECRECKRGFFLNNNTCLEKCPVGYRADRITWACLEPPVFAWYWVYPSRNSCKNYCGFIIEDWDCSCSKDCFMWGNCCQDIEYHCTDILFWRKNNTSQRKSEKSLK